ncbi:DMT family transporter [Taibaiella helva]|uniref:DMT family transporter n=1 Tax=Taibaiella helva TaxID=2301235 RepID=UPI0018E58665|nr:SMR family transporter [Taibaiella helva]
MNNWIYWGYLLLAALMEALWTYSLKVMQFRHLKQLTWSNFYIPQSGLKILAPFAGYICFGIANVYFFSMATRQIPLATAFAAWTGASLVLIKLSEVIFFQQKTSLPEVLFILMIMGGITGLKFFALKS